MLRLYGNWVLVYVEIEASKKIVDNPTYVKEYK